MVRAVLLIIDVQEGFMSPKRSNIINPLRDMLSFKFDLVIQMKYKNYNDSHIEKQLGWSRLKQEPEQRLVINVDNSINLEKSTYSAVTSELLKILSDKDIVYISGVDLGTCILATAFDLFDKGIVFRVVEETVSTNSDMKSEILQLIKWNFGEDSVVNFSRVLRDVIKIRRDYSEI